MHIGVQGWQVADATSSENSDDPVDGTIVQHWSTPIPATWLLGSKIIAIHGAHMLNGWNS